MQCKTVTVPGLGLGLFHSYSDCVCAHVSGQSVDKTGNVKVLLHLGKVRRVIVEHPNYFSLIASVNGSLIKALNGSNGITAD